MLGFARMMHRGLSKGKSSTRAHHAQALRRLVLVFIAVVISGCPARFDPRAEPAIASTPGTIADPTAAAAYRQAKERLAAGDWTAAERDFREFAERWPADPRAPAATLWRARSVLSQARAAEAASLAEPLATRWAGDAVGQRARLILGLALAQAGNPARARELLAPFALLLAGEDAVELHAALATAAVRLGDKTAALAEYGLFYDGARPVERDYVWARALELVAPLPLDELGAICRRSVRDGLACALYGRRAAEERPASAGAILAETAAARRRYAVATVQGEPRPGRGSGGSAIGLLLPLSGRNRPLGERALRGALLAANLFPPVPGTLDLRVRDTKSNPAEAARALGQLAAEGVAAVMVSPEKHEAQAACARAETLGVPLLELAPDENVRGERIFKLVRLNQRRAVQLSDEARARGARRVAVLHPESPYGRKMAEAFVAAARERGLTTVGKVAFDEKTTTFIKHVKRLAALKPEAVFVPSTAMQLSLIAAQLYASGLTNPRGGNRGLLLLATGDGLSARFLASAGRYVQGAVLAPVFYPDESDARIAGFVARFREQFGDDPSVADALAFDGLEALRQVLASGAKAWPDVAERLRANPSEGLTGPLGFGAGGERRGEPRLFVVEGEAIHLLRPTSP